MYQEITRIRSAVLVCLLLAAAAPMTTHAGRRQHGPPAGGTAAPETRIEVAAVDKDGKPVESLRAADLAVTIDGAARPVVSIRRVSRGPGAASDAARRQAGGTAGLSYAAEPSRTVIVVIDQATLIRGKERQAVQGAGAFLDRLGLADRLAVLRLPKSDNQQIELTTERPVSREALALVTGLAQHAVAPRPDTAPALGDRDRAAATDAGRTGDSRRPTQEQAGARAAETKPLDAQSAMVRSSLGSLLALLKSMKSLTGRKVIAVFSPGLVNPEPASLLDTAAAAIGARATIYVFGVPSPDDDPQAAPDVSALQSLAESTGGAFVMLGKKAERDVDRVISELSATYVLGIAPAPGDGDGKRHTIRVQSPRKDVTLRAASWLLPAPEAADVVPASPQTAAGSTDQRAPISDGTAPRTSPVASDRDAELQVALGRMLDYVASYEKQDPALVAEEEYRQRAGQRTVLLRSDFLLVKQEQQQDWVSFRDVFEVDGSRVRDREDRLKRLFLEPAAQAWAQLRRIADESARYNIGPIDRDINVPLFPLKFLTAFNRQRFGFVLGGRAESAGVPVWRIEFTENKRPTLIRDLKNRDVPAAGYFLVAQGTGAIVETAIMIETEMSRSEIVVKYRLDPGLGMWVPAQMTEIYRAPVQGMMAERWQTALEGLASYSKFRRFQVKTEEKVTNPK